MIGRLYTTDEIFKAIKEGTIRVAAQYAEMLGEDTAEIISKIGGGIAYETADILGFDMEKLVDFCNEELEKGDYGED